MAERAAQRMGIPESLKQSLCSLNPKYMENVRINTQVILWKKKSLADLCLLKADH